MTGVSPDVVCLFIACLKKMKMASVKAGLAENSCLLQKCDVAIAVSLLILLYIMGSCKFV